MITTFNQEAYLYLWELMAVTGIIFFIIKLLIPIGSISDIVTGMMLEAFLGWGIFLLIFIIKKYDIKILDNKLVKGVK